VKLNPLMDKSKLMFEPSYKALVMSKLNVTSREVVFLNKMVGLISRLDNSGVVELVLN
jgi:hypothetical protein